MRRFSRKADLSLSTNAIVVMIIAITILGLALGFTQGVFTKLGDQIRNIGGRTVVEVPPTSEEPLTLTSTQIDVQRGKDYSMTIAIYNKYSEDADPLEFAVSLDSCYGEDNFDHGPLAGTPLIKMIKPGPKSIELNEYQSFETKLTVVKTTPLGVYACTISAKTPDGTRTYASKDVLVTVMA